jgi:hypothetical protein
MVGGCNEKKGNAKYKNEEKQRKRNSLHNRWL